MANEPYYSDTDGPLELVPVWNQSWVWWSMRVLAIIALGLSVYLALVSYQGGSVQGCGGLPAADCDSVLKSPWARIFGVPVAVAGAAVYGLILFVSFIVPHSGSHIKAFTETLLLALALAAVGSGIYFLVLQLTIIDSLCVFCLAVHLCGLILTGLVIWHVASERLIDHDNLSPDDGRMALGSTDPRDAYQPVPAKSARPSAILAIVGATLGLAALIGGQFLVEQKQYVVVEGDENLPSDEPAADGEKKSIADPSTGLTLNSNPATESANPHEALRPTLPDDTAIAKKANPLDPPSKSEGDPVVPVKNLSQVKTPVSRPQRVVTLWGGRQLDLYAHPALGNRDARYVVAKLFDYTCPACRKVHTSLERARKRYGDQLVLVMLPTPLSPDCNKHIKQQHPKHLNACKYARLALAVAQRKPEAFAEFHDWLMRDTQVPTLQAAANKAIAILDSREALHEALRDPRVDELIQQNVNQYGQMGRNELPTMFFLEKRITGVPTSKQLFDLLEKYLLILPVE